MSANQKFPIPENDGAANHLEKSSIPSISLPNQDDITISLKDFKGKKVLIWFFTKASTGGCTREGLGFNDHFKTFEKHNISIIGSNAYDHYDG
mgnify:CR=1 FL=1